MELTWPIQTKGIALMRMALAAVTGGMSLGIGVFVMLGIGSFGGLEERDGVFVILMGVIILALGKICDILVEIRDK